MELTCTYVSACPDGFFRLPGYNGHSCYRIVYDNLNWADAGARCRTLIKGSHLLVIENESENTAIVEYLTSIKGGIVFDILPIVLNMSESI